MDAGREKNAGARDEDDPAEEGVEGGEDFGGGIREVGAVDGAFAAHQHGGFEKGIEPGQSTDEPIAENAEGQGEGDEGQGDEKVIGHAPEEDVVRGDRLAMVLEGHPLLVDRLNWQTKEAERPMGKLSEKVGSGCWIKDMGYWIWEAAISQYPIFHIRYSSHPTSGSGRSWIRTSEGVEPADLQSAPFGHFGIRPGKGETRKKGGSGQKRSRGEDCLSSAGKVGFGILRC